MADPVGRVSDLDGGGARSSQARARAATRPRPAQQRDGGAGGQPRAARAPDASAGHLDRPDDRPAARHAGPPQPARAPPPRGARPPRRRRPAGAAAGGGPRGAGGRPRGGPRRPARRRRCSSTSTSTRRLLGDPARVAKVFDNLLVNALRHGGPHVAVRGRIDGDWVELTVSDDGAGVPATAASRGLRARGGTRGVVRDGWPGLGLSIARDLCRAMGGDLEYRHGTRPTFAARFPAVPPPCGRADASTRRARATPCCSGARTPSSSTPSPTTRPPDLAAGEAVVVAATPPPPGPRRRRAAAGGRRPAAAARHRDSSSRSTPSGSTTRCATATGSTPDASRPASRPRWAGSPDRWASFRVFGEIVDLYRRADRPGPRAPAGGLLERLPPAHRLPAPVRLRGVGRAARPTTAWSPATTGVRGLSVPPSGRGVLVVRRVAVGSGRCRPVVPPAAGSWPSR